MTSLSLAERADAYNAAYAKYPASHLSVVSEGGHDCLYGRWVLGNDYRNKTRYYGAYPPGYLDRVMALFPDSHGYVLHAFSGSLPAGPYVRCDVNPANGAELACDVLELASLVTHAGYRLVIADPPYSSADAEKYETAMVDRRRVTAALAQVTMPGRHLVWLDTCWPMHRKTDWITVARIAITRSTNHRLRDCTIFQRRA